MTRSSFLLVVAIIALAASARAQALRVDGRHFVDPAGRVVVLRGVNLAGDSKVPPFIPIDDPRQLDPIVRLGFNCVRLVISWEAVEPRPGKFDQGYLARMKSIAAECSARGLYVIVDVHQDGFSRYLSRGSGDGFPPWAASPRARLHAPNNGPSSSNWPVLMALDPGMHKSFADFYSDANGVRTLYLRMVGLLAREFSAIPLVIGYDMLNEPWGNERREIAPLHADAAKAIQAEHPSAILFFGGHVSTISGTQTFLPRPGFSGAAYAPHYYKLSVIFTAAWYGETGMIDRAFGHMNRKVDEWGVPLFVGEFGVAADTKRGGDFVAYIYDRLDDSFASGAQWNYTPHWNHEAKDGWNGEYFNILAQTGGLRGNFRPRAFPRMIAGEPCVFRFTEAGGNLFGSVEMIWHARPNRGETEIFLPTDVFPATSEIRIEPAGTPWRFDPSRQVLTLSPVAAGRSSVRVIAR